MQTGNALAHIGLILGQGTARLDAEDAWIALETRLGVSFPADFVRFCDEYGPGRIAEFLRFYHPAHAWNLADLIFEWEEMFGEEETDVPYRIGWGIGHAMPFADTRNGDMAYFLIRTGDPATWHVGVQTRSGV